MFAVIKVKTIFVLDKQLSISLKNKKMTTQEIKTKGLKWSSGNGCEMYVVVKIGEYQWWMISEKTGKHMVSNKGKYGQAFADERVLAHWNGFKQNQNR